MRIPFLTLATQRYWRNARIICGAIALLWVVEAVDVLLLQQWTNRFAIVPRTAAGAAGILLAPFLHDGLDHVAANTLPLLVLGWLVMLRSTRDLLHVTAASLIASGLAAWLFGRSGSSHLGASGLAFGFLGFLLVRAWLERSLATIGVAAVAFFLYGGLLWGLLPGGAEVSWLGHAFGLLGGAAAAKHLARRRLKASTTQTAPSLSRPTLLSKQ